MRVGPRTPADAPNGKPVPPPKKHCRHCGTQSETFAESCPNCGRSYGASRGAIVAAIIAACVAVILVLGGCAVLVGLAVDEAEEEIDETAITKRQFDSIEPGSTEAAVRARLGDPIREEEFNRPRVECIYYAQKGEGLFGVDDFQFCFANGVLDSKSFD